MADIDQQAAHLAERAELGLWEAADTLLQAADASDHALLREQWASVQLDVARQVNEESVDNFRRAHHMFHRARHRERRALVVLAAALAAAALHLAGVI